MCIIQFIAKRYKKLFELGVIKMPPEVIEIATKPDKSNKFDNLEKIIKKGIEISKLKGNNKLFSSFKRTVTEWQNKIDKTAKEIKKLKIKYQKEFEPNKKKALEINTDKVEILEKTISNLYNNIVGDNNSFLEKMKNNADKYIKNIKDYSDPSNQTVAKNPKTLKTLKNYQQYILNNINNFKDINNKYKNLKKDFKKAQTILTNLLKIATSPSIDKIIKTTNSDNITASLIGKFPDHADTLNNILPINNKLENFILDYDILKVKEDFSKWFKTEGAYLAKFEKLTDMNRNELLKYINHSASITNDDTNQIPLNIVLDFCNEIKAKDKIKGTGLKYVEKKSLYDNANRLNKQIDKKIRSLVSQKAPKMELNLKKVAYMYFIKNLSEELLDNSDEIDKKLNKIQTTNNISDSEYHEI